MAITLDGTNGGTSSAGWYGQSAFTGTFSDGIVVDYTTGMGRISVGTSDGLTIYSGGVANTARLTLDASGNLGIGTTSVTEGGKLSLVGAKSLVAGIPQGQITASDSTALATGVGGAINFSGVYTSGGSVTSFASVEGYKENATDGNYAGAMVFKTRTNGGSQTERARIDSSGNLLVGTTTSATGWHSFYNGGANGTLQLRNTGATAGKYHYIGPSNAANPVFVVYNQSAVGVYLDIGATAWSGTSDERLKTDLTPIVDAVEKITTLRAVTGRFKTDDENKSRSFLIAQDVQKVLPEAISENDKGYLGIAYTDTIPLLVAAIKELTARLEALENK